ncbi:uncharacterized protein LOC132054272 [Lycium ferocissimum]|uniref:uncharacterized protein LOC132054272 n=1 Tax=Lycium ferocissimum TaxID=112874 RepID=UPI0028167EF5|nr:uncharacterized protein LOC132054272 [Lycium ferocissimum]
MALLNHNLLKVQQKMKVSADRKRQSVEFSVGDWVFVKLKLYRQHSLRLQRHHKLGRRYFGPFKVIKRIGQVAYKLDLPEEAKIHHVFHVSMLRRCVGIPETQVTPLRLTDAPADVLPNLVDKVFIGEEGNVMNKKASGLEEENGPAEKGIVGSVRKSKRATKPPQKLADYIWKPG